MVIGRIFSQIINNTELTQVFYSKDKNNSSLGHKGQEQPLVLFFKTESQFSFSIIILIQ
jgi:hypothetical protein